VSQALAVAVGGAAGSLARWLLVVYVQSWLERAFPWATLTVNVVGSFAMGVVAVVVIERMALGPLARAGLLVGFLGAFTTFSTFALETVGLAEHGLGWRAVGNVVASVAACVVAAWCGLQLGRYVTG